MARHIRLLSNVGFPALYQFLFSYLLLLGNAGGMRSGILANVVIVTALVGIPLTVIYNFAWLPQRCSNALLLIVRPVLAAMVLPLCQLALLSTITQFIG